MASNYVTLNGSLVDRSSATLDQLRQELDIKKQQYNQGLAGGRMNQNSAYSSAMEINDLSKEIAKQETEQQRIQQQKQFNASLQDIMNRADPFASQRAGYQTKLSDLMNNPAAAVASNPFFSASADAGQEAAKRRLAQMGMGTSGNAAFELQKQAQANMSGDYFRMADLLSGLAGGKQDPSAGANAGLSLMNLNERAREFDYQNTPKVIQWGQPVPKPQPSMTLSSYWGK